MTKEEFFEKYVGDMIAVHVPTKELAYELMAEAEKHGIEFDNKNRFSECQSEYKERFYLKFTKGTWFCIDCKNYEVAGYTVIKYKGQVVNNMNKVIHPSHYNTGNIEVIEVIYDWKLNFNLGNAIKYIARADHKENPIEDLQKAANYIAMEIEYRNRKE